MEATAVTTPSPYSPISKQQEFIEKIAKKTKKPGQRPLFVLDMDGNVLIGYNTVDGKPLPGVPVLTPEEIAQGKKQTRYIPADADIDALLKEGKIVPTIFANGGMDVRLPKNLVEELNRASATDRPFDIAILTSRGMEEAEEILRYSDVKNPEKLAFFADSSATAYIDGKLTENYEKSPEEIRFLKGLEDKNLLKKMEAAVDEAIKSIGEDPAKRKHELYIQPKHIATNIHWREIMNDYKGQGYDFSPLDKAIATALQPILSEYLDTNNFTNIEGKPVFKYLGGPATTEIKIAAIDKGLGLEKIVELALDRGVEPSSIIYVGDDIAKFESFTSKDREKGFKPIIAPGKDGVLEEFRRIPGTDYFAFAAGPKIEKETKIPFFGIHTLHPLDGSIADINADPQLSVPTPSKMAFKPSKSGARIMLPMTDSITYPAIRAPEITTNSPVATGQIVKDTMVAAREREAVLLAANVRQEPAGRAAARG